MKSGVQMEKVKEAIDFAPLCRRH